MKAPSRARRTNPAYADAPTFRDRRVEVRAVECPTCLVPVGEKCTSTNTHRARRRAAVRELNLVSTEVPDLDWLLFQPPNRRKTTRRLAGISQTQLAQTLGVHMQTLRSWETGQTSPSGSAGVAYVNWLKELS